MKFLWILLAFFLVPMQVEAKSAEERLQDLETQVAQMQNSDVSRNAKVAQSLADLDQLKSELTTLNGNSEAQEHRLQEILDKSDRLYRDLEMRLAAFESQLKVTQVQITKALAEIAPKVAEEGKLYEQGLAQVQNTDTLKALATFEKYLKTYPKGTFAGDAQFWIAECRYSLTDYEQAIKDYQKVIDKDPKSAHAPAALLRQGIAFQKLNMGDAAKTFLNKLIKDFPNSPEAVEAQTKLTAPTSVAPAPPAINQKATGPLQNNDF